MVGTPSSARRGSADGKIALGLQSQTSVRQAARTVAHALTGIGPLPRDMGEIVLTAPAAPAGAGGLSR
jgi:hypothetical protein